MAEKTPAWKTGPCHKACCQMSRTSQGLRRHAAALAANQNHRPVLLLGQVEHAGVLLLLPRHGPADELQQLLFGAARANGVAEADLAVSKEADLAVMMVRKGQGENRRPGTGVVP